MIGILSVGCYGNYCAVIKKGRGVRELQCIETQVTSVSVVLLAAVTACCACSCVALVWSLLSRTVT